MCDTTDKQSKQRERDFIGTDAEDLKDSVEKLLSKSSNTHHYRFKPLCEIFWNNYTTPQLATLCACFYKDKQDKDYGLDRIAKALRNKKNEIEALKEKLRQLKGEDQKELQESGKWTPDIDSKYTNKYLL